MVSHIIAPHSRWDKSLFFNKASLGVWRLRGNRDLQSPRLVMSHIYISPLPIICWDITLLVTEGHSTDACHNFLLKWSQRKETSLGDLWPQVVWSHQPGPVNSFGSHCKGWSEIIQDLVRCFQTEVLSKFDSFEFEIWFGQQWRSTEQRNKICLALDTHTILISRSIHSWYGSAHEICW